MKYSNKINKVAFAIASILFPISIVFCVIGFHSNELITKPLHYSLCFVLLISTLYFFINLGIAINKKKSNKENQIAKSKRIFFVLFLSLEIIGSSTFLLLLYSPIKWFRNWLVPSAMATMNHKYLATWFYSEEEIEKVLEENQLIELLEDIDLNLIHLRENFNKDFYENEYEKEIFTLENLKDPYKIVPISEKNYKGYLAIVYDPSRISVATTKHLNEVGQYVTEMASENKAFLAINGGGFLDQNKKGTGGIPEGVLIQNSKILSDAQYGSFGGVIGFTKEHKLFLGKVDAKEALKKGVRDAVSFRPFLIVNGKKSITSGNGGWGYAPRTAIGQRKDGIVLMLVLDGRTIQYPGATLVDLMNILYNYGAVNAANLDGGTSSVIVLPKEKAQQYITEKEMKSHCKKEYCYINDIVNGSGDHMTRPVVSSFIVK